MKYFAILITAAAMFGALSATAQQPGGGRGQQGGGFGGPPRGAQGGGQGGAQGQGGRQGGARSNAVLQAIDADGDHEISVLEIEGAAAALRKLDKNQDGKLTHDEIHPDGDMGPGGQGGRGNGGPGGGGPGGGGPGGGGPGGGGPGGGGPGGGGPGGGGPGGGGPGGGGRPTPEQFFAHAMTFDADGDGKISKSELEKMAQAVTEEMSRRGGDQHGQEGPGGSGRPGRPSGAESGQSRQRPEID